MREWQFTQHALRRMAEMGVHPTEVLECLEHPEVEYLSAEAYNRPGQPRQRTAQRGRIAVPYVPERWVVVTVLWRTDKVYKRKEK